MEAQLIQMISTVSADSSATDEKRQGKDNQDCVFVLPGFSQQYRLWCSEMSLCLSSGAAKCNSSIGLKDSLIFLLNAENSVDAELALISTLVSIQNW